MSHAALVQEEGIASLYKGIRPTLLGIMPYASWQEADVTDAARAAANLNSRCIKLVGPGWRLNIFEFYGSGKDISPTFWYIYVRFRGVYCILLLYLYQLLRIFVIHSYYHAIHIISYNHK